MTANRPICDYEGSGYRDDFWVGQGREYEDLAERIALRRLLPPRGRRLLEIGAGFGRLADLYAGYDEVVLLDYSRSLLRQAQERRGGDRRFRFVAGDLYDLPFADGYFDAIVMVRVIHHVVDVPLALRQARRVLAGGGGFLFEFANKRNLKAIARYLLRRQPWNPCDPAPVEFVTLNFNFHPAWMAARWAEAGLRPDAIRSLSHFRLAPLKRALPPAWLARADGFFQPSGAWLQYTPSILARLRHAHPPAGPDAANLFRCLACGGTALTPAGAALHCPTCGKDWPAAGGLYDFKPAGAAD
jgi:SAM-dependent methyltransferase